MENRVIRAKLRHLRIAPKKVRAVSRTLKGMPVDRALAELETRAKRATGPLAGLLRSAIANATNVHKLDRSSLRVKNVLVDPGPPFKRILHRAMGRATSLWKRTSHVTIMLETQEGLAAKPVAKPVLEFVPAPSPKSIEREKEQDQDQFSRTPPSRKAVMPFRKSKKSPPTRRGFIPKIFSRKVI